MQNIDNMKVSELKEKCKAFDLKSSGQKEEIQDRLREFVKNEQKKKGKKKHSALYYEEKKKWNEIKESLEGLKNKDLKEMLVKNNVKKSGNKIDLMERICDCKLYGPCPQCPECGGGTLQVTYPQRFGHKGQGQWFCKGYHEDDHFRHCHFKSNEEIERKKWKD